MKCISCVLIKRGRDLVLKDSVSGTIWAVLRNYFPEPTDGKSVHVACIDKEQLWFRCESQKI